MKKKETASNQITIYETDDGKARIEVRFENENVCKHTASNGGTF